MNEFNQWFCIYAKLWNISFLSLDFTCSTKSGPRKTFWFSPVIFKYRFGYCHFYVPCTMHVFCVVSGFSQYHCAICYICPTITLWNNVHIFRTRNEIVWCVCVCVWWDLEQNPKPSPSWTMHNGKHLLHGEMDRIIV